MDNELFRAIVVIAGFIFIIKHLGVWLTGLLGLGIALFGCGSEGQGESALNQAPVAQMALTQEDHQAAHDQCVLGQTARINQGFANCMMLNIRGEEYCQTCKENEWANVESKFIDIEADAKAQYMECLSDPATQGGFFTADFCVSLYYSVIQQQISECQRSLYCFTI